MEEYEDYLDRFIKRNKVHILCCKECGYEMLIIISKAGTLCDLYRIVEMELDNKDFELYVNYADNFKNKIENNNTLIKDFLIELRNLHNNEPVYPLPKPVVYKLWLKDK